MYTLTDEQIDYINDSYCDSREAILLVADALNETGLVKDEEDFIELVIRASFNYQNAQMIISSKLSRQNKNIDPMKLHKLIIEYMPIEEMVKKELINKYPRDFEAPMDEELNFVESEDEMKQYFESKNIRR